MNNEEFEEGGKHGSIASTGDIEVISEGDRNEERAAVIEQISEADSARAPAEEIEQSSSEAEESTKYVQPQMDRVEDRFVSSIETFSDQLKETNRLSGERERIIDRLHEENQRLKQGELQQALLPVFRDLIRLYDDLKLTVGNYSKQAETDNESVIKDLGCYQESICDILYRYGVEQIEVETGKDFDSKEHKAVATSSTECMEDDRKISKIIRDGFRTETKIIRNVEVEVYRFVSLNVEAVEQREITSGIIESQTEDK